ncbi:hypothetical protein PTKIN_Ptkin14bG0176500 [Pterospermum kingtungense]
MILQDLILLGVNMSSVAPNSFLNMSSYITTLTLFANKLQGKFPVDVFRFPCLQKLTLTTNYLEINFPKSNWSSPLRSLVVSLMYSEDSSVGLRDLPDSIGNLRFLEVLDLSYSQLKGSIPVTLGNLTRLSHLNLAGNSINGQILFSFSNFKQLTSLDLSSNNLVGPIIDSFGNLTKLVNVSIRFNNLSGHLPFSAFNLPQIESLDFQGNKFVGPLPFNVSGLSRLRQLYLGYNFLSGKIPSWVFSLPSLAELSLHDNKFNGRLEQFDKVAPLETVDLQNNMLSGLLPFSIFNLTQIEVLDLSVNKLEGPLPTHVSGLSKLRELHLNSNFLSGKIPSWLFSLPSLVELRLSYNSLTGPIEQFDNKVAPLETVELQNNKIDGPIPSFSKFVNLTHLDLSSNKLNGIFDLTNLSKLQALELSNNAFISLSGGSNIGNYSLPSLFYLGLYSCAITEVPDVVRNLTALTTLELSYNRIRVMETHMFLNLGSLEILDLSHNSELSVINNSNVSLVLSRLELLALSSCNITQFPNFLTSLDSLLTLDLSNNTIRGQISKEEIKWGKNLEYLDLSRNFLTVLEYYPWRNIQSLNLGSNLLEGPFLVPPPSTKNFIISKNKLIGEIPSSICSLVSMEILDLSNNNLSGAIPQCLISGGMMNLSVLDLHMNKLQGNIPDIFPKGNTLRTVDLNNNDFDGPLPKSLVTCHNLKVLNLGNNKINDTFPYWLGTLPQLQVLVLRANYFHGQIVHSENESHFSTLRILDLSHNGFSGILPTSYFKSFKGMMNLSNVQMVYMEDSNEYYQDSVVVTMKGVDIEFVRILAIFTTIDMSSNKFEGIIPEIVGKLTSLQVLNFSHNKLTGHIPTSFGNLAALESLDLSSNKLVGEIPKQLASLNFLEVLNLSQNQLVGQIPQGKQFNTFLNDSYEGNLGLCGFPLSKRCGPDEPPAPPIFHEESDSSFGLDWQFVLMGYGCGMVCGFSAGYIMLTIQKPKWLVQRVQHFGNKVLRRLRRYG